MELKKTVEVINHVWVDDLNEFLVAKLGRAYPFTDNERDFPKEHYVSPTMSKFDYFVVENFIKGESDDELNLSSLLNFLCKDEVLDEGYYLINRKIFK